MKKTAVIVILLTVISKIIGFGREITLSFFFGASSVSDAYIIAITIPTFSFSIIGTGLAASYIPMYNSISKRGLNSANNFTNNLLNLLIIFSLVIITITFFFTDSIVKLFASGFDDTTINLAANFTKISIIGVLFSGIGYILRSNLQINGNFIAPALIGLPFNVSIVSSIILAYYFDVLHLLPIGITIGFLLQVVILIPSLKKKSFSWNCIININDPNIKKMIYLSLPVIIGVSANEINSLVDRTIASQLAVGGISSLNYAFTVIAFVQGVFSMTLATLIYPTISKMAVEKNLVSLKDTLLRAINTIIIFIIPSTVGVMIFARPITSLLFGRGAFDNQAITMTSCALFFYSIGLIGMGFREILTRVFFSLQDTRTPMINAAYAMLLNIILNIILSHYMGISGLALATSISVIICSILLFFKLPKKIGRIRIKSIIISFIKISISSMIMGAASRFVFNNISGYLGSENIALLISICVGIITYSLIILMLRIDEIDLILDSIKKRRIK